MPKTALTGGGTMGHVLPNLALMQRLRQEGHELIYIGSKNPAEKEKVTKTGTRFHAIESGKLRRYADIRNFTDIFRIFAGFIQSLDILRREKPGIVFSKGGFVAVPVVFAAFLLRIPSIIHESDISMGLANRLCKPFAKAVCYCFEETGEKLSGKRSFMTGLPVRKELFAGNREKGLEICGFTGDRPVLLVMGGSQGARTINRSLYPILDRLTADFQVCHIRGRNNSDDMSGKAEGYVSFGYVDEDMPHILAAADIILSRAGATSLFEFLALRKPNLLIPIAGNQSRGEQVKNARSFEKKGFSRVLTEDELNDEALIDAINETYAGADEMKRRMSGEDIPAAGGKIVELINRFMKRRS